MTMIKLSNDIPFVNTKRMFVAFPNFNGEHIFDLSDYDILIYYYKLFENRTNEDKFSEGIRRRYLWEMYTY